MKLYERQFRDCSESGRVLFGPERVVPPPRNLGGEVPVIRLRTCLCGRFGGVCEDHNERCQEFRQREV